nr:nucleoside hydrolase [Ameyamaea chiangmaiensis]
MTPYAARADEPSYIIEDNDFLGPGGSDIQSTIPLLADPHVRVLGFTVAAGDAWENEESAHLRRFLEIAHREDVPVADGATLPLINSVALMRLREQQFGTIPWKGAWGGLGSIDKTPATQPAVTSVPEGMPTLRPANEPAALFLIHQVHAHPHQVTILCTGPMTNLALAIRLDPTFASTAKQLVFMGGLIDTDMMTVTGNADFASDFNLIFDPEAAHITVTADWPKIVVVGNVSNDLMMTKAYMAQINVKPTPVTRYLSQYYAPLPMWDEMAAAIAADPTLVTHSVEAYMDVETTRGISYGHAYVWPKETAPLAMGVRKVTLVQTVDAARFLGSFVRQAQSIGASATAPHTP